MTDADFGLCVDYGTSNTVAVLRWPDGRVRPLLFDGSPLLVSAVFATPDGRIVVGRDAERSARLDPARYEPNPKRMVDAGGLLLGERSYPVAELIAATLRRVHAEAVRTGGVEPARVTLTHPAAWGPQRRAVLQAAAGLAGFARPAMMPEPVAAATYFTRVLGHRVAAGECVVVYDLGAGTFDVSVVRRSPDGFQTVATAGLDAFGGLDLDAVIVQRIGSAVPPTATALWHRLTAPVEPDDRRSFRLLWDDARAAKEMLSRQPVAAMHVPLIDKQVHLTREEFEQAARPALEQTVDVTLSTIGRLRESVVGVFLVGGSSRIPLVATLLHQRLAMAPTAIEQPEIVVAEGGLHAAPPANLPPLSPVPVPASVPDPAGAVMDVPAVPLASPSRPAARRRPLVLGIAAFAVVAMGVAGLFWLQTDRNRAGQAFGDAHDLRDFAAEFIERADACAGAPATTHRQETGLTPLGMDTYRAVVRCTGDGWTAYFYDCGSPKDASDPRVDLYHAIRATADQGNSWGPGLATEKPRDGTDRPTYVEFAAGNGATGIYWEPHPGPDSGELLAAVLIGRDAETIRTLWQAGER
ncbi:Hsp70 family protein [Micromonospora sp. CPCC 205371]|nr:Hsp70 family protein [Micromonospora sp. CPCC 205371]